MNAYDRLSVIWHQISKHPFINVNFVNNNINRMTTMHIVRRVKPDILFTKVKRRQAVFEQPTFPSSSFLIVSITYLHYIIAAQNMARSTASLVVAISFSSTQGTMWDGPSFKSHHIKYPGQNHSGQPDSEVYFKTFRWTTTVHIQEEDSQKAGRGR